MLTALLAALLATSSVASTAGPVGNPAVAKPAAAAALAPGEIVGAAPAADWVAIAPEDLLVMDLAADAGGHPRRVVIQLMPPPFSQGWIGNIRTLAAAHWWDGLSVNRVQDNYVAQWGDAEADNPAKAKTLPQGLATMSDGGYTLHSPNPDMVLRRPPGYFGLNDQMARLAKEDMASQAAAIDAFPNRHVLQDSAYEYLPRLLASDTYAFDPGFYQGWPLGHSLTELWPIHCYGMVGVGRGMPPDAGSGAELYAVIGTPPRHLDRNIALIGRVIEGIEHLSSLPRGTGPLGFYESAAERVRITAIRLGSGVPGLPRYEYLSTESASFARYADARANRRDPFFIRPAGGADICNVPVPVRRAGGAR